MSRAESTEIFPNEGVEIQAVGSLIQGIFGVGGETSGYIHMLLPEPIGSPGCWFHS